MFKFDILILNSFKFFKSLVVPQGSLLVRVEMHIQNRGVFYLFIKDMLLRIKRISWFAMDLAKDSMTFHQFTLREDQPLKLHQLKVRVKKKIKKKNQWKLWDYFWIRKCNPQKRNIVFLLGLLFGEKIQLISSFLLIF